MDSIITDNSNTGHIISSKIDMFFSNFAISKLLKKSNFYKEGGIQCVLVLKEIFGLVFSGKNLFRTLKMNPEDISFKKNAAYRFLNSSSYNWARLLLLLVTIIIESINKLTSNVELLSRVFDHTTRKFVKGFKMHTIGWSDGTTFLPVAFSLLSSRHENKVLCPVDSKVDKRSVGYKKRTEATANSTETLLKLLDSVKGLPAKYLLFDSWFAFPKTIVSVVKPNLNVICMLKISSKIHYFYQGEWMNLKEIYKRITPSTNGNIIGSVTVSIRESKKNSELVEVKIVFVKDRHSKNWLAVLFTDITISDEAEDIKFSMALMLVTELLKKTLHDNPVISEEIAHQIMEAFILALPAVWKKKLKLCA